VLFRYIAHKSSIRRLMLSDLPTVPLSVWKHLGKLRESDAMSISGFCDAHNLNYPSVQSFIAHPSPWLTCLSVRLEVVWGVSNWGLLKGLLEASPHLTDLTVHSPDAFPCPRRLLGPALVPRLQQISLDNFDLMIQLKEGRPIRSISIYSRIQLEMRGRTVLFDQRVETLNLTLKEVHLHRVAEVVAHSTGVRSLGLSITSSASVCYPSTLQSYLVHADGASRRRSLE